MNISLAVAGVVAAGLGLLTMHTAFNPLPKAGVPVVIATSHPEPTRAAWRHTQVAAKPATDAANEPAEDADAAPAPRARPATLVARRHAHVPAVAEAAATPVAVTAAAPASKPPVREVAAADLPGQKLCKAPSPQLLSAKSLRPVLILRYDAKARPFDIPPPQPAADDEQRRLKLSALLGNILSN